MWIIGNESSQIVERAVIARRARHKQQHHTQRNQQRARQHANAQNPANYLLGWKHLARRSRARTRRLRWFFRCHRLLVSHIIKFLTQRHAETALLLSPPATPQKSGES